MVEAQARATDGARGGESRVPEPYVEPIDLGPGEFVDPVKAAEFLAVVDEEVERRKAL